MTVSKERLGVLYVLVGPGGVGKNALLTEVIKRIDSLSQLPTATTRAMRASEQQGREHQFVSVDAFQEMIANDELLEYQEVHPGSFYGVPRETLDRAIVDGRNLIADIDILGARIIRDAYPKHSVLIFVAPPDMGSLEARLLQRESSKKDIDDRLDRAALEMLFAPLCEYVIVNDDFDLALDELQVIAGGAEPETVVDVSYTVEVTFCRNSERLVPVDSAAQSRRVFLSHGEEPRQKALTLAEALPGVILAEDRLTLAGSQPISVAYSSESRTYHLTYRFDYALDTAVSAPRGWVWKAN